MIGGSSDFRASEQPFGESPDPRYFYNSAMHARVLSALREGVQSGARLQVFVAPPGLGKTVLLRALLQELRDQVDSAFVFNTQVSPADFVGFINQDFGIENPGPLLGERLSALTSFLTSRNEAGATVLIVIDEAQNLDASVLAVLDELLATAPQCLRLILSGQSKLAQSMNTIAPERLRRFVEAFHELMPLDQAESIQYIEHRLSVAGYSISATFARDALDMIAAETSGVPRNINTLCFHALHHGPVSKHVPIDAPVIAHVLTKCAFLMTSSEPVLPLQASAEPVVPSTPEHPRREEATTSTSTPSGSEERLDTDLSRKAAPLVAIIRQWLETRSGTWTGTAWELKEELQRAHSNDAAISSALANADLEQAIQQDGAALLKAGIEAEVRSRKTGPRYVTMRLLEYPSERRRTG